MTDDPTTKTGSAQPPQSTPNSMTEPILPVANPPIGDPSRRDLGDPSREAPPSATAFRSMGAHVEPSLKSDAPRSDAKPTHGGSHTDAKSTHNAPSSDMKRGPDAPRSDAKSTHGGSHTDAKSTHSAPHTDTKYTHHPPSSDKKGR